MRNEKRGRPLKTFEDNELQALIHENVRKPSLDTKNNCNEILLDTLQDSLRKKSLLRMENGILRELQLKWSYVDPG